MKIIFVRHGKHLVEEENGQLNSDGKKQSFLLAKRLKKINIKKIYSSPMKRAKETAEIIQKILKVSLRVVSSLSEWDSALFKKDEHLWNEKEKVKLREIKKFLEDISKNKNKKETILIVAHGQTNKLIISYYLNIPHLKTICFRQTNTCINVVKWNQKFRNWRLLLMNDSSHFSNKLGDDKH